MCMCVCVCMHACMHVYYVCVCVCVCACMSVCLCMCMCFCMEAWMHKQVCMCVCLYKHLLTTLKYSFCWIPCNVFRIKTILLPSSLITSISGSCGFPTDDPRFFSTIESMIQFKALAVLWSYNGSKKWTIFFIIIPTKNIKWYTINYQNIIFSTFLHTHTQSYILESWWKVKTNPKYNNFYCLVQSEQTNTISSVLSTINCSSYCWLYKALHILYIINIIFVENKNNNH